MVWFIFYILPIGKIVSDSYILYIYHTYPLSVEPSRAITAVLMALIIGQICCYVVKTVIVYRESNDIVDPKILLRIELIQLFINITFAGLTYFYINRYTIEGRDVVKMGYFAHLVISFKDIIEKLLSYIDLGEEEIRTVEENIVEDMEHPNFWRRCIGGLSSFVGWVLLLLDTSTECYRLVEGDEDDTCEWLQERVNKFFASVLNRFNYNL